MCSLLLPLVVVTPPNPAQSQARALTLFPHGAGAVFQPPRTSAAEFFMLPWLCLCFQPDGPVLPGLTLPPAPTAEICSSGTCSRSRFLAFSEVYL